MPSKNIAEANRTNDYEHLRKVLCHLWFARGFNYSQSKEWLMAADPSIDAERYEEICSNCDLPY